MLVAIDAAAERPLRVVQVKHLQPIEADQPLELPEGGRVAAGRADVVAGGEQMAGVEADADPAVAVGLRDDRCELLERGPERRALPGGLLEQNHRLAAAPRAQQLEERRGDEREAIGLVARGIASRVQDDAEQAERFGAIDLVAHRLDRHPAQRRQRGGEVDQVAAVRHDGVDAGRRHLRPELADLVGRQRAAAPLARVLGEDLQRLAAVRHGALHGPRQPAGHRHVRA